MTRINLIPVQGLTLQHLIAEYREAPRIYDYVLKHGVNPERIPEKYCLGNGHVLFFTDKLDFIHMRIQVTYFELLNRGIKPTFSVNDSFKKLMECEKKYPESTIKSWLPSQEEINISAQRIYQKIAMKPNFYTYHKKGGEKR